MRRHSLSEPIRRALRQQAAALHVSLPARIEQYDHAEQRANVLPLIKREYADGLIESIPVVSDVPVVWPRSGGAQMTMPVKRGDTVLLVFADRSIDNWLAQGGEIEPDDRRQHDISDAVAIPGLVSFADWGGDPEPSENNDDVLLRYAGSKVRIKPNGDVEVEGSANIKMTAPGDIDITAGGDVNIQGSTVNLN